jgi:DNA-binding protein HU-beta
MKKADFIKFAAERLETTGKEATETLDKVFSIVEEALVEFGEVPVGDLGKLVVVGKDARIARNPSTGESIEVPAKNVPKFKPSKHLKEAVL